MKDAYTEISVEDFKSLSDDEKGIVFFMTLKNLDKKIDDGLKKKCQHCKTRLQVTWIIAIGSPLLGFLIGWLGWLTTNK